MADIKQMSLYQIRMLLADDKDLGGVQRMSVDEYRALKRQKQER